MRFSQAIEASKERFRRPSTWGAVALFGLVWNGFRLFLGPHFPMLSEGVLPFLLAALILGSSALPWQWTGDERPMTSPVRGLFQSLLWNYMAIGLVLSLSTALGLGDAGRGDSFRGRGRGLGRGMGNAVTYLPGLPAIPARLAFLGAAGLSFGVLSGWILAERDREEQRAWKAMEAARQAQSRALQAQMNPHVLFNALSGLSELAREDPGATEEALVSLADLLRRLLAHASQPLASLDEEKFLVERLLVLEKFRFGERLQVRWVWNSDLEHLQIPPLLLQPLVENALKHGIAKCRSGGEVEIGLEGDSEHLRLWVANTGLPLGEMREGTGLGNLKQRLELLPNGKGDLQLYERDGRTWAELRLDGVAETEHDSARVSG